MWMIPILIFFTYIGLNTLFSDLLVRLISHPKYSLSIGHEHYNYYFTLLTVFGFALLIFRKKIRRQRIKDFIEYAEENRYYIKEMGMINGVKITLKELDTLKRTMKLDDLSRKIKKDKIKKILTFN